MKKFGTPKPSTEAYDTDQSKVVDKTVNGFDAY